MELFAPPGRIYWVGLSTLDDMEAMMHNGDAMRTRDDRPATKEDLKNFPTKEDAKLFATKEDLKQFLTKEDAKQFATKDDLAGFARETRTRFDTLEAVIRRQTMTIVTDQADLRSFREEIVSMFHAAESRNAARMDAFMSNTLRVEPRQHPLGPHGYGRGSGHGT